MARDAITVHSLSRDGGAVAATPLTINVTNGAYVPASLGKSRKFYLEVSNTDSSARVITIKAGEFGGAGAGNLAVSVTNGTTFRIGPLSSYRFKKADGTIDVDFATSFAGTIVAVKMP